MAFIVKKGSKYQVRQGNNNDLLLSTNSKKKAEDHLAFLHAKNKPKATNRGASAKKRATTKKKK